MNRRISHLRTAHICLALLALFILAPAAAPARRPERERMPDVRNHARALERDARLIAENGEANAPRPTASQARELRYLQAFARAAYDYNRAIDRNFNEPDETDGAYRDLRRTYEIAIPRINDIPWGRESEAAIARVNRAMQEMLEICAERPRGPRMDYGRITSIAHALDEDCQRLYDAAREDYRLGRINGPRSEAKRLLERLDDLRDAADDLRKDLGHNEGEPWESAAYVQTVENRWREAASQIRIYGRDAQQAFERIGRGIAELSAMYGQAHPRR